MALWSLGVSSTAWKNLRLAYDPDFEKDNAGAHISRCTNRRLTGETEKAAKEVQVNLREPLRIIADNDGHVITSVIIQSL